MLTKRKTMLSLSILCLFSLSVLLWLAFSNISTQIPGASANQPLAPMGSTIPHPAGTILTQQQMHTYMETHRFFVGPTVSGKMFTIQTVQLMTARQAYQEKRADSLGVPLNELVYYVVAVGPFKPINITSPHQLKVTSIPSGYEIWDAYTGILLGSGL